MLSLLLALVAAGCNALSSVLQRKANKAEAQRRPFGAGLVVHLFERPIWLLGLGAMIASFVLQASALSMGTLSAVEPVLVLELPLALILGAIVLGQPLTPKDWLASVMMAAGLGLLIGVLAPSGGDAKHVSLAVVVGACVATIAAIALLAACARVTTGAARSALFGVAAGSGFGLTAGLMKLAVSHGLIGLFSAWQTYAMVLVGIASLLLEQAALNAGTLVAAQPGITLLDPLVSVLWGTVVVGEVTRTGPILVLAAAGAVLIVVAALRLIGAAERAQVGAT